MKQCKLCGIPFKDEITRNELNEHWQNHHKWHWEKNKAINPEDAILKKR